jgi:hypothetical protein
MTNMTLSTAVTSNAKKIKGDKTIHHDHATTPVIFMVTRRAVIGITGSMAYWVLIGFMVVLYTCSVGCQVRTLYLSTLY